MLRPPYTDAVAFHSRGAYTKGATISDIQALIDDLEGRGGGTVWICRELSITEPLKMRSSVRVDFQRYLARLADVAYQDPAYGEGRPSFAAFSGVDRSQLVDAYLRPTTACNGTLKNHPVVQVGAKSETSVTNCLVRHLVSVVAQGLIVGDHQTAAEHCFDGVLLDPGSGGVLDANTFEEVFFIGVCNGALLREASDATISSNLFWNWENYLCQAMITFVPLPQAPSASGYVANTFDIIRGQSDYSLTHAALRGVSGTGNHFDHIFIWDIWYAYGCCPTAPPYQLKYGDFGVTSSAEYTYINSESINGMLNCAGLSGAISTTRVVEFNHPLALWTAESISTHITCSCSVEPLCLSTCCGSYPPSSVFPTAVSTAGDHLTYCYCTTCGGATGYTVQGSCASTRSGAGAWSPGGARPNDGPPEGLPERPRSGVPSDFRILGWRDVAAGLR